MAPRTCSAYQKRGGGGRGIVSAWDHEAMDKAKAVQFTPLRKVGGSVMLAVPQRHPRYKLEELLVRSNRKARRSRHERQWLTNPPAGREVV